MFNSIGIVVPHYNEPNALSEFIKGLASALPKMMDDLRVSNVVICIVDDGSSKPPHLTDASQKILPNVDVVLLTHLINLGQGAALQTGIEYFVRFTKVEAILTMDADGQHSPHDIPKFIQKLRESKADIVFGNRFGTDSRTNAPTIRRATLKLAILFERLVTGLHLSDAHNGFRIFTRNFAEKIDLKQNRMAHATEFKQLTKKLKAHYEEVSISITYSEETLRKGQHGLNSINILRDLLKTFLFDQY